MRGVFTQMPRRKVNTRLLAFTGTRRHLQHESRTLAVGHLLAEPLEAQRNVLVHPAGQVIRVHAQDVRHEVLAG